MFLFEKALCNATTNLALREQGLPYLLLSTVLAVFSRTLLSLKHFKHLTYSNVLCHSYILFTIFALFNKFED